MSIWREFYKSLHLPYEGNSINIKARDNNDGSMPPISVTLPAKYLNITADEADKLADHLREVAKFIRGEI